MTGMSPKDGPSWELPPSWNAEEEGDTPPAQSLREKIFLKALLEGKQSRVSRSCHLSDPEFSGVSRL